MLEHTGLLGCFASLHGATFDGTVRHEDQMKGAGWGPAPDGELAAAGAAVVVPTPAEVPAALAALSG